MGPAEQKCFSKSYISNKKRSTLLRHYSRKCDEIKEKTSFKDAYNGTFIEPTPVLDEPQLQEAPKATQLECLSNLLNSESRTISCHSNNTSASHNSNFPKNTNMDEYNELNRITVDGTKKAPSLDIRKHMEKYKRRTTIPTKMQRIMAQFDIKMVFIAILCFLCFEASGNNVENLFGEKLQKPMQHQSRLMRNKRDSHISGSAGM